MESGHGNSAGEAGDRYRSGLMASLGELKRPRTRDTPGEDFEPVLSRGKTRRVVPWRESSGRFSGCFPEWSGNPQSFQKFAC